MLVLSRKSGEAIVFPELDITVTVSQIRGRCVSLGIEASNQVRILRKELVPKLQANCTAKLGSKLTHSVRNKLNSVGLSLNVLLRQIESGSEPESEILRHALGDLHLLDESLLECSENARSNDNQRLALLVEDNENESALLSAFLRDYGFRVVNALDGRAAINFLDFAPVNPDIVLMDMNMPRMSGPEAVREIRQRANFSGLKLFAISGMSAEDADVHVGSDGVNRWFQKPIQPDELVRQINHELAA